MIILALRLFFFDKFMEKDDCCDTAKLNLTKLHTFTHITLTTQMQTSGSTRMICRS